MLRSVIRWIARAASVIALVLLALFLFGEGTPPRSASTQTLILLACFPVGVAVGMAIGWWRELPGGIISVGSLAVFYVLNRLLAGAFPRGFAFAAFALPGLLFIVAGLLARRRRD